VKDASRREGAREKGRRTSKSSLGNDLSLELEVRLDHLGSKEVVRVVLDDDDSVLSADLENLELSLNRRRATGRVTSNGNGADSNKETREKTGEDESM